MPTFVGNTLFFQNFKVVLFWLACLSKLTCPDWHVWTDFSGWPLRLAIQLSCPDYPAPAVLSWIFRNSCLGPAVMFFLPYTVLSSCYFIDVLSQHSSPYLSCPSCPVLASMSDGPVLSILSCVPCPSCPGKAVQSQPSCSCRPVLAVLGCAYMVVQ